VIVIDTNPFEWEHKDAPMRLNDALQHILTFMNAHLAGRHDNKLAVIASHVGIRYIPECLLLAFFIVKSALLVVLDRLVNSTLSLPL